MGMDGVLTEGGVMVLAWSMSSQPEDLWGVCQAKHSDQTLGSIRQHKKRAKVPQAPELCGQVLWHVGATSAAVLSYLFVNRTCLDQHCWLLCGRSWLPCCVCAVMGLPSCLLGRITGTTTDEMLPESVSAMPIAELQGVGGR